MKPKITKWITRGFILFCVLIYAFPLYWMVISSIKTMRGIYGDVSLFPSLSEITLATYYRAVEVGFFRYMLNSFLIAIGTMLITLVLAVLASYAISRLEAKWVKWTLIIFLLAQMLPPVLLATPIYMMFDTVNLTNTYIALILANTFLTLPISVIILRPVMNQIPRVMEEAAIIDGATFLQTIYCIILPVVKPGLVVVGTISFLMSYGEFLFALTLINESIRYPVTMGIYTLTSGTYAHEWNAAMAYSTLATIPVLILFLLFQKYIVSGLTRGSVR